MSAVTAVCLLAAMLVDRRFGDPDKIWSRIPHPVELFGKWISFAEQNLNAGDGKRWKGAVFLAASCLVLAALGLISKFVIFGEVIDILLAAALLAHKSLVDHLKEVASHLRVSVSQGRRAVAKIVGRDVSGLDASEVAKAATESAAEGFSDGVVAPCFWFLIFGLPGILVYKFVNTADSMIGYRSERFAEFGWAAARLDDVLNWIPARIAAAFILAAQSSISRLGAAADDARLHISPNAGWPESAMAHALDIALGGPRSYQGEFVDLRHFNDGGRRRLDAGDIDDSIRLIKRGHRLAMLTVAALAAGLWILF